MFDALGVIVALSAVLAWANTRFLRLPTTIGVMAMALVLSLVPVALASFGYARLAGLEREFLAAVDFSDVLLDGMLSLLLFAGALHVDLPALARHRRPVAVLAVLATTASAVLVGFGTWHALAWAGIALPLVYALAFGTLISPTDPIAVLGILRTVDVPKSLEVTIAGESLFNDGVGVVLFALTVAVLTQGDAPTLGAAATLFAREAFGGAALGIVLGGLAYAMLRGIDDAHVEILLTLGLVLGGYALASALHLSGPIATVVAGLFIGHVGRRRAMSENTRDVLDTFWAVVDELLNVVLFALIGLEVVLIEFPPGWLGAALLVVGITLLARLLTVGLPIVLARGWFGLPAGAGRLLTWGGLRGGISVALALSLPPGAERDTVVMLTYCVVLFSILVQGLTIAPLARRVGTEHAPTR